jgi:hypothetical protein
VNRIVGFIEQLEVKEQDRESARYAAAFLADKSSPVSPELRQIHEEILGKMIADCSSDPTSLRALRKFIMIQHRLRHDELVIMYANRYQQIANEPDPEIEAIRAASQKRLNQTGSA